MGIIGQGGKNVEERLETSRVPRLVTGVCSGMGSSQFRGSWKTGLDVGMSDGRCRGLRHGHGMVVRRQGRQGLELKARGRVLAHTALTEPWLHPSPELALPPSLIWSRALEKVEVALVSSSGFLPCTVLRLRCSADS